MFFLSSPIFVYVPFLRFWLFGTWIIFAFLFFIIYYFNKRAFTFYITNKSVLVEKSWVFGSYNREMTFDQIKDIHVMQGILARLFKCGSLAFTTTTGLEVGYVGGGAGVGGGVVIGGGRVAPTLVRGRGNSFWDILEPQKIREMLTNKLSEWREVVQQQQMSASLTKIAEKPTFQPPAPQRSITDELVRLNELLEKGAITKEEYEKLKKKILD